MRFKVTINDVQNIISIKSEIPMTLSELFKVIYYYSRFSNFVNFNKTDNDKIVYLAHYLTANINKLYSARINKLHNRMVGFARSRAHVYVFGLYLSRVIGRLAFLD